MNSVVILLVLATSLSEAKVETWTLDDLSKAMSKCFKNNCVDHPDWIDALNKIMYSLYSEKDLEEVYGALPSHTGSDSWTRDEVLKTLDSNTLDAKTSGYLEEARARLNYYKNTTVIQVIVPAVDISTWTLEELTEALNSTSTSPKLISYLLPAYVKLKESEASEKNHETIHVITPVGLVKGATGKTKLLPLNESFIELYIRRVAETTTTDASTK